MIESSTNGRRRVDVLGVAVDVLDMDQAIERIATWIDQRRHEYICVTGVHGVMESQRDPELLAIHNVAGMTTPDGVPLVWASRFAGARDAARVCGTELFPAVAQRAARESWRFFFYGGKEGVPELLAEQMLERFPGLDIVGTYSPPFRALTPEEDDAIVAQINESGADVVWVGLSTPKQERWMASHVGRLDAPVLVGVGAAFDLHAGLSRRAPVWMRRTGLEWLYRMLTEPRLIRRYLGRNPRFVWGIMRRPPSIVPIAETSDDGRV